MIRLVSVLLSLVVVARVAYVTDDYLMGGAVLGALVTVFAYEVLNRISTRKA